MVRKYLFYFSGQLGLMLQMRFFFQWIIDFAGGGATPESLAIISTATLGFVLFLFRAFDAFTDPLSGMFSDYLVSKGSKRTSMLLYSAPILPIGLILCFSISSDYSLYQNWIVLLIGLVLFFTSYTLYCIPYWSLIDDFSAGDNRISSVLSSLLGQGLFTATAIGFVLTPVLITKYGYFHSALLIAIISFPLMILPVCSGFEIKEKKSTKKNEIKFSVKKIFSSLFEPIRERVFFGILLYFIGSQMAFTILTALSPHYVIYILGENRSYVSYLMAPVILLAIITFLFIPKIMKKYEWERILHLSSICLGVMFVFSALITSGLFISIHLQSFIIFSLIGPLIALILGVEAFAIAKGGEQSGRAGMYFGAFNFVIKGMNGVALWSAGVVSEQVIKNDSPYSIRILLGAAGILLLILSIYAKKIISSKSTN